ncbi:MAG: BatA and WFA domain-containing protein [Myxococcota bacterium]|nr:BatA and WFA domain-containing protein [Myxococcota bacterium]
MSFLKPGMLFGLLAALIPIIIHLIHKRKPRKHEFAAIEFVIRSVQRIERQWRLRRFLLLACRMLLIAALVFAAAHPMTGVKSSALAKNKGPKRIVMIIDGSLSMRSKPDGGRSGFAEAKSIARQIIEQMTASDQMLIVLAERKPRLIVEEFSNAKASLLQAVTNLEATYAAAEISDAVNVAGELLSTVDGDVSQKESQKEATETSKHIIILSDLAAHSFQQAASLTPEINASVVNVFESIDREEFDNYGISQLEILSAPGSEVNAMQARVRIRSYVSDESSKGTSASKNINWVGPDGTVAEASVSIVGGNETQRVLEHSFTDQKRFAVSVVLEDDVLTEDNQRFAMVNIESRVRTLIIDGQPSGLPKEDEIYYFERAFAAGASEQPAPKIILSDDLQAQNLDLFDVVVLAGVNSITTSDAKKIETFVESGGGLLISSAQSMDIEQFNGVFARLLPRTYRGFKERKALRERKKNDDSLLLGELNLAHPVLSVFRGDALQGLKSTRTQGYFLLQPNRNRSADVLATFEDGQPALIESQIGGGKVIVLTTSIDRDLTDLAIRPAFVPLVRQLVLYLGDALAPPDNRRTLIGDARRIRVPKNVSELEITDPNGEIHSVSTQLEDKDWLFTKTALPGYYQVKAVTSGESQRVAKEDFVVNVDRQESNLETLTAQEAIAALRGQDIKKQNEIAEASAFTWDTGNNSDPNRFSQWLLIAMLCFFLMESLLTAQRRKSKEDRSNTSRESVGRI